MAGPYTPQLLEHPSYLAEPSLTSGNRGIVLVIAVVALAALAVAAVLVRQVLAAGEGTDSMKKIAAAVQEGANAYLARQLRTLGVFAWWCSSCSCCFPRTTGRSAPGAASSS